MKLFDSHAHLDHEGFPEGPDKVIARAVAAGVAWITTIGSSRDVSLMEEAVFIARAHKNVWAAVGIHPHEADGVENSTWERLGVLLDEPVVMAVGECGLDYHYMHSPREAQIDVFRAQIRLAREKGLPLVLHCRKAHEDCINLLREETLNTVPGIIHCFSDTKKEMDDYLGMGFYVSIPGIVTFKKAGDLREAIKTLPLNRLLLETDSPYLAPVPFRGKRNEPAMVVHTAGAVAELLGISLEELAITTVENTRRVYGIRDE